MRRTDTHRDDGDTNVCDVSHHKLLHQQVHPRRTDAQEVNGCGCVPLVTLFTKFFVRHRICTRCFKVRSYFLNWTLQWALSAGSTYSSSFGSTGSAYTSPLSRPPAYPSTRTTNYTSDVSRYSCTSVCSLFGHSLGTMLHIWGKSQHCCFWVVHPKRHWILSVQKVEVHQQTNV